MTDDTEAQALDRIAIQYGAPTVAESLALAKGQVVADIAAGVLPNDIPDLSTAHDFTDANYYGLFTDAVMATYWHDGLRAWSEDYDDPDDPTLPETFQLYGGAVHDRLAAWLEDGRPGELELNGCPVCKRDIDRLGGNPDCPTCAAEPRKLPQLPDRDQLALELHAILDERDDGRAWDESAQPLVAAVRKALEEAP